MLQNEDLCVKNDEFVSKMMNLAGLVRSIAATIAKETRASGDDPRILPRYDTFQLQSVSTTVLVSFSGPFSGPFSGARLLWGLSSWN